MGPYPTFDNNSGQTPRFAKCTRPIPGSSTSDSYQPTDSIFGEPRK